MNKLTAMAFLVCFYLIPSVLLAATYDGSMPLLCAPNIILECEETGDCHQHTVESANISPFVAINFEQKTMSDTANHSRTSMIKHLEHIDGHLVLQGVEHGRGWSIVIDEETGFLSASTVDEGVGFVIFGACTPRE